MSNSFVSMASNCSKSYSNSDSFGSSSRVPSPHNMHLGEQQQHSHTTPDYPIAKSLSIDHDPDHRSYTRHTESSESARPGLFKPLLKSPSTTATLSEMSSFLSASSSLSGSTQHPCENDEDCDVEETSSVNSKHPNPCYLKQQQSCSASSLLVSPSEQHLKNPHNALKVSKSSNPKGEVFFGDGMAALGYIASGNAGTNFSNSRNVSACAHRSMPNSSCASPVLQGQGREYMTTHQIVQHHTQQQNHYQHQSNYILSSNNGGNISPAQSYDSNTHNARSVSSIGDKITRPPSSAKRLRFKHYLKPTVTDSPRLVFLCQQFIKSGDADSLAVIARRRGLPPKLRRLAWPLLLASHPYVLNPNICVDSMSPPTESNVIPVKRIVNEIARYQKKKKQRMLIKAGGSYTVAASSNTSASNSATNSSINGTESQPQPNSGTTHSNSNSHDETEALQFTVIQEAVENFLTKWGHIVPYDPGMVYVAFALSDYIDMVPSSTSSDVLGSAASATDNNGSVDSSLAQSLSQLNVRQSCYDSVPGSPSLQAASALQPKEDQVDTNKSNSKHQAASQGQQFLLKSLKSPSYTFSQVFNNFMLVLCHSPVEEEEEIGYENRFNENDIELKYKSETGVYKQATSTNPSRSESFSSLPKTPRLASSSNSTWGGCNNKKSTTTDRISFFLSAFRRLLPDLATHFDEEDVLSGIGGDEWVLYWIKWLGAKVWDKRDRARIWDMHLGWRQNKIDLEDEGFMEKVAKACKLSGSEWSMSTDCDITTTSANIFDASNSSNSPNSVVENGSAETPDTLQPSSSRVPTGPNSSSSTNSSSHSSVTSFSSLTSGASVSTATAQNTNIAANPSSSYHSTSSSSSDLHHKNSMSIHHEYGAVKSPSSQNFTFSWQQLENEIGPDPFWTAGSVLLDKKVVAKEEKKAKLQMEEYLKKEGKEITGNENEKVLLDDSHQLDSSSESASSTPKSISSTDSLRSYHKQRRLPLSQSIDPLTEHLFFCLALLKSKSSTLLELDQSEIRGLLSKLFKSNDIESLVSEACEMWRTWEYEEEEEDEDDDEEENGFKE